MEVCISVKALYESDLESPYGNHIIPDFDYETKEMEYYDLYNDSDELACMDGEWCHVVEKSDHHVLLRNDNGDGTVYFCLTLEEFEIAAFKKL